MQTLLPQGGPRQHVRLPFSPGGVSRRCEAGKGKVSKTGKGVRDYLGAHVFENSSPNKKHLAIETVKNFSIPMKK